MITAREILKNYWDYDDFRGPQEEIIQAVIEGTNSIVLLPTGGGKSMCFQIPGLLLDGVCIVVSPLIALMQDQVKSLKDRSIKAVALTSQLSTDDIIIAFDNLQFGDYKFLYISPEKLNSELIQEKLKQLNISLIAIDEAHCISEWGHDFRPAYLKLNKLLLSFPKSTVVALTGTATDRVLKDIQTNLELKNPRIFKKSFYRSNLNFSILKTENRSKKLLELLGKIDGAVIIYTNRRKATREIANFLMLKGFKCSIYHGGLDAKEKEKAFNDWSTEATPIMVATNAFGMGIDKDRVRAVIHVYTPNSIENFVQEAGRAGRDGRPAEAIILTSDAVLEDAITRFEGNVADPNYLRIVYDYLNRYYSIPLGELPEQTFNLNINEFCNTYHLPLLKTYNALSTLAREGILLFNESTSIKSSILMLINHNRIHDYIDRHPDSANLLRLILRTYGGIFEHSSQINEYGLAGKLGIMKTNLVKVLKQLQHDGILEYTESQSAATLHFLLPREDKHTINRIKTNVQHQLTNRSDKLKAVIRFITNNKLCRNRQILEYFGEDKKSDCGHCDVCLSKIPVDYDQISTNILTALQHGPRSSHELCEETNISEDLLLNSLKILLDKNKITITSQQHFKLKSNEKL